MDITLEQLMAKRQECASAVEEHKALMNANAGAIQVLNELIALKQAQKPSEPSKK